MFRTLTLALLCCLPLAAFAEEDDGPGDIFDVKSVTGQVTRGGQPLHDKDVLHWKETVHFGPDSVLYVKKSQGATVVRVVGPGDFNVDSDDMVPLSGTGTVTRLEYYAKIPPDGTPARTASITPPSKETFADPNFTFAVPGNWRRLALPGVKAAWEVPVDPDEVSQDKSAFARLYFLRASKPEEWEKTAGDLLAAVARQGKAEGVSPQTSAEYFACTIAKREAIAPLLHTILDYPDGRKSMVTVLCYHGGKGLPIAFAYEIGFGVLGDSWLNRVAGIYQRNFHWVK